MAKVDPGVRTPAMSAGDPDPGLILKAGGPAPLSYAPGPGQSPFNKIEERKGKERKGKERKGKERKGKERKGKEGKEEKKKRKNPIGGRGEKIDESIDEK